jgi:ATP-dependent Clp protease protease subunit
MKFWNMKKTDDKTGELMLYGDISSSTWWGDEVTPKQFKTDLDKLGDISNLNIYINSGGGDVFAGQAIHSMLSRHTAYKTVYIDGLAASIASVIAMAGDKVVMPKNAMMMIHKAWTIAAGNADDFRKVADDMEKIEEGIVATYRGKTNLEASEIMELMTAETWLTAEDAISKGFADEIEQEKQIAASIDGGFLVVNDQKFSLDRYKNKPQIEENPDRQTKPISQVTVKIDADKLMGKVNAKIDEILAEHNDRESGGESGPASDNNQELQEQLNQFHELRKKINK